MAAVSLGLISFPEEGIKSLFLAGFCLYVQKIDPFQKHFSISLFISVYSGPFLYASNSKKSKNLAFLSFVV